MSYDYVSVNGVVTPVDQAAVPINNIEYAYGFGVYETVRVKNGAPCFVREHAERLLNSAQIIGLEHNFTRLFVEQEITWTIGRNQAENCNVKVVLVGAPTREHAKLYVMCLNPLYPDRSLYTTGATLYAYEAERILPQAKTLNMLQSYLAYREAKKAEAYDALLINRHGCVAEGTRTNFFCLMEKRIISPKEDMILPGVMRRAVLDLAVQNGFTIEYADIPYRDLSAYECAFITSTSTKLMPIRTIKSTIPGMPSHDFGSPPPQLKKLAQQCDELF